MEFDRDKIKRKTLDHYHSERLKTYNIPNYDSNELNQKNYESSNSFNSNNFPCNLRSDKFGNLISKKNIKNFKISFIDEIEKDKPLAKIYKIESFRKHNSIEEKKGIK
jgi:hypothetical protein